MTFIFRLLGAWREARWRRDRQGYGADRISAEHLAEINLREDRIGVDLPAWRSPKEIAAMRWQERLERLHKSA